MNLLLDSHTFIWSYKTPYLISESALSEMSKPVNQLFLSLASVWEIQLKIMIDKLNFQDSLADIIAEQKKVNNLQILPIKFSHIIELENLPFHHKDPFDRLLIAQAKVENMRLVSSDSKFSDYQVDLFW